MNGLFGETLSVGGAAGFLAILYFAYQSRGIIFSIFQQMLGVVRISLEVEGTLAKAVQLHLASNYTQYSAGRSFSFGRLLSVRAEKKLRLVPIADLPSGAVFFAGMGQILRVSSAAEGKGEESSRGHGRKDAVKVRLEGLRFNFEPDKFLAEASRLYDSEVIDQNSSSRTRFFVRNIIGVPDGEGGFELDYDDMRNITSSSAPDLTEMQHLRPIGYRWDQIGVRKDTNGNDPFAHLVLDKAGKQVLEAVSSFLDDEEALLSRGFEWKLGLVLEGDPGNGKSRIVQAIAKRFDLPIFSLSLATLTDGLLNEAWRMMLRSTPCIVLIEDFHTVFDQDRFLPANSHNATLSLQTLLNLMDGVEQFEGVITVITTNKVETLSPALGGTKEGSQTFEGVSERPGRVHDVVKFGNPTLEDAKRLADKYFPEEETESRALAQGRMKDGMTWAQVTQICRQEFLSGLRKKKAA